MATANIAKVWHDSTNAYVAATVLEASGDLIEYHASTPLNDPNGNPYTVAQLKANLVAALQSVRNAQLATTALVAGISGTVTI